MTFSKDQYLDIFIAHFNEFISDVASLFPRDNNVQSLKKNLILISKINKKTCIVNWKYYVVDNFRKEIENNDYNFFINNDWSTIITHRYKDAILIKINELRESVRLLSETNKIKALKYVENLVKLCDLYNLETSI